MVDFAKRAAETGDLEPDESVIGACNMTPVPLSISNAGLTGGLIAGGLAGMAVGAAWDRHVGKKAEQDAADAGLPPLADREPFQPSIPPNGALVAVTERRLVAWRISGLGKPKEILFSVTLRDIDRVRWRQTDKKLLRGVPESLVIWAGIGDATLQMSGLSGGSSGKHVRGVVRALEERLPGRVAAFGSGD